MSPPFGVVSGRIDEFRRGGEPDTGAAGRRGLQGRWELRAAALDQDRGQGHGVVHEAFVAGRDLG